MTSLPTILRGFTVSSSDAARTPRGEMLGQIGHVHLGLLFAMPGVLLFGEWWGALAWAPVWATAEALQWRPGAGLKLLRDAAKDGAFWATGSAAGWGIAETSPYAWGIWAILLGASAAALASGAFVETER